MIPTLPLALRNRLAGTILRALGDLDARRELAALAGEAGARRWLETDEARWAGSVSARARAAAEALAARPPARASADLGEVLDDAGLLFDAGLFFEVHEVLEPVWAAAAGQARQALQGLIQVAVGWQHLANGNRAGAQSLLHEGAGRLHGGRLPGVELEPFARAAADAAARIACGMPVSPPRFPRA